MQHLTQPNNEAVAAHLVNPTNSPDCSPTIINTMTVTNDLLQQLCILCWAAVVL
jgi:hypothetical protein